jgi:hypothetical protein
MAIVAAFVGAGVLAVRWRGHELQERLVAHCEAMFERMPDTFPPKKMMRGIEDIQARTARIQELLDADHLEAAQAQQGRSREPSRSTVVTPAGVGATTT